MRIVSSRLGFIHTQFDITVITMMDHSVYFLDADILSKVSVNNFKIRRKITSDGDPSLILSLNKKDDQYYKLWNIYDEEGSYRVLDPVNLNFIKEVWNKYYA